jgi:cyclase
MVLLKHKVRGGMLLATIVALLGAYVALAQNAQAPPENKLVKVTDDLYTIIGDGGNSTSYITDQGIIMIDDQFERDHADIVAKLRSVTDKPVKYVINTHAHGDHTGGNLRFQDSALIIAHANVRNFMIDKKMPGPPQIGFADELDLSLGGKQVIVKHFGPGHTNGDSAVYIPALKAVCAGDVFNIYPQGVAIDYSPGGGSILGLLKTIDGILQWDFDTVIPGHGAVSKRADLVKFRDALEAAIQRVRDMTRTGASKDDVAKVLVGEFGWNPAGAGIRGVTGLMAELKQ